MPHFNIVKKTTPTKSFRCQSLIGTFDLSEAELGEHFEGDINIEGKEWKIGLIVGGSGTGKTTIARELFGEQIFAGGGRCVQR